MTASLSGKNDCTNEEAHKKALSGAIIPEAAALGRIADFFYVMSDKTRLSIICLLEGGSLCVGHIAEALGMTQSAVSHQLALMKRMNLVSAKKEGRNTVYSLSDEHISLAFDIVYKHIME